MDTTSKKPDSDDLRALINCYRNQALVVADTANKLEELALLREEVSIWRIREAARLEQGYRKENEDV